MPEDSGTATPAKEDSGAATSTPSPARTGKIPPLPIKLPPVESPPDQLVWDAAVFDRETPDYLIPKMDQRAVSTPTYFQQLVIHDPGADVTDGVRMPLDDGSHEIRQLGQPITEPIDPFMSLDDVPLPGEPIFGALISFEQGWYEKGLALGRLMHSTCLAPGEVTKIAVTSFHRQTRGSSDESATQQDSLDSATDNASAVAETQNAVSHELKTGLATNMSMGVQAQAGGSMSALFASANASVASNLAMGLATAVNSAATDFKAEGAKNVSQRTVAASHAVRARRASQVRETSEDESQTGQTRVIANYNHMHAMTMMFFEVLQCFSLETRVIDAERVVYIPMRDMNFTPDNVRSYSEVLRTIFIEQSLPDMVGMLDTFLVKDIATLQRDENAARQALEEFLRQIPGDLNEHPERHYPNYVGAAEMFARSLASHNNDLTAASMRVAQGDTSAANAVLNSQNAIAWVSKNFATLPLFIAAHAKLMDAIRIVPLLNAHRLAFNQHMWMRMDASRVQRLVYQKVVEVEGKRLALDRLMDPKPIGVFGNFVAFRLPQLSNKESIAFAKDYITEPGRANSVTASIVLPSGGLFGEAVLGQAISAEKIDLTRFWNWQDSPIPILPPELSPMSMGSRARDVTFSPVEMEKTIVELIKQDPALMQSPAELAKTVVAKVGETLNASLGALQAAQVGQVGAGATAVGEQNVRLQKQAQDFTVAALNSKAVNTALGMAFPEGQAANMMGGLLGEGGKSATVMGGALGAAKPAAGALKSAAGAAKKAVGDALEEVVDLDGIGTLTPIP
jgi:hypothetical protein